MPYNYTSTFTTSASEVTIDTIFESLLEVVDDQSTWISECSLSEADKEASVVCLAEISGAVRLAKKLLKLDEVDFHIRTFEEDEEK